MTADAPTKPPLRVAMRHARWQLTTILTRSALTRALRAGRVVAPHRFEEGKRRVVSADDIAKVLCSGEAHTPLGLRLHDVRVRGRLDLTHADVPFPASFTDCVFEDSVTMHGAHLPALSLEGCELPALEANGLQIDHDLTLSGTTFERPVSSAASESAKAAVWLCEAVIGGRVLMIGTRIMAPAQRAIQADRLEVGGTVRLIHGFSAQGQVRLIGAQIHGSLDLTGAQLTRPYGGLSLDLGTARIDGSVFIIPRSSEQGVGRGSSVSMPPLFEGRIDAGNAVIGGRLVIRDATIHGTVPTPGIGYSDAYADKTALLASGLRLGGGVELQGACRIHGGIELEGCDIALLSVASSVQVMAPGLNAIRLSTGRLRTGLFLAPGLQVKGTLRFTGADIGGNVTLRQTTWSDARKHGLISGQAAVIRGEMSMQGIVLRGGSINLRAANLQGTIDVSHASLSNPNGLTLDLHQANVAGSAILNNVKSSGCVLLSRSRISGGLRLEGASLSGGTPSPRNSGGHALSAEFAEVLGGMQLQWAHAAPSVSLEAATTTVLTDDPASWPEQIVLNGFSYQRFGRSQKPQDDQLLTVDTRLRWLKRSPVFDPGSYEQLARVLHQHGLLLESEQVLMASRKAALSVEPRGDDTSNVGLRVRRRISHAVRRSFGIMTGYGYRPSRTLLALVALTLLVGASLLLPGFNSVMRATDGNGKVFSPTATSSPHVRADSCGQGAVVCFNPAYYAIDTVVPLVGLGQRSSWHPDEAAPYGWFVALWLNTATLTGWLLTSLFALALTRAVRVTA